MPKSIAEERVLKIHKGIQLLQEVKPNISLTGLDKGVFIGPGPEPERVSPETQKTLEDLGFTWSSEQESWEFYTGHS